MPFCSPEPLAARLAISSLLWICLCRRWFLPRAVGAIHQLPQIVSRLKLPPDVTPLTSAEQLFGTRGFDVDGRLSGGVSPAFLQLPGVRAEVGEKFTRTPADDWATEERQRPGQNGRFHQVAHQIPVTTRCVIYWPTDELMTL